MMFVLGLVLSSMILRLGFSFVSRRRKLRKMKALPGYFSSLKPQERATLALAEHGRFLRRCRLAGNASDLDRIEACVLQYGQACADIARKDGGRAP